MSEITYKKFDKTKLKDRKRKIVSSEEALKDIIPIEWGKKPLITMPKR